MPFFETFDVCSSSVDEDEKRKNTLLFFAFPPRNTLLRRLRYKGMADRRSAHLSVSPVALREATGQANNFEMTPIWRRMRDDAEEEEKKKVDALAVVASSSSAPSNNAAASAAAAAPIEQRRLDAQRHRHAEVWTKDPHGGRHRPVSEEVE